MLHWKKALTESNQGGVTIFELVFVFVFLFVYLYVFVCMIVGAFLVARAS